MGGDGKMGNNGKMGSDGKMVRRGEKSGILGEKRGDRCLVINSHWSSAPKASAPIEQVGFGNSVEIQFQIFANQPSGHLSHRQLVKLS